AIEHAFAISSTERITFGQLPREIRESAKIDIPYVSVSGEEQRLLEALALESGNRSRAAQRLGIGRATLYRRLKALAGGRPRTRD
ncbi:MAG: hypothetical protein HY646_20760, partial [Acidobacteria bacterium]|nr:hypothetical protein [Acidobacteriota bacterium]